MVGKAVEQGGGHFGVAEDARPFAEGEIGGDDDRGALVEPVDQMKQHLAAGLSERQIAELVEDDKVHAGEAVGQPPLSTGASLVFQPIDEVDDDVEAAAGAAADCRRGRWRDVTCRRLPGRATQMAKSHSFAVTGPTPTPRFQDRGAPRARAASAKPPADAFRRAPTG